MHYGMPRRSGRYPWGSGENPYQHSRDFLSRVEELKKRGLTEKQIADEFGISTTNLRAQTSLAKEERRLDNIARMKSLYSDGYNRSEVARMMGVNESTLRSWENEESQRRTSAAMNAAKNIKAIVDEKGLVDVGIGVEKELNISKEKLNEALEILKREGYEVYGGRVQQATNKGQMTTMRIIGPPGTEHKDIYNYEELHSLKDYTSHDDGDTFQTLQYPASMDSKRLAIRYAEEGGIDKDGVIEIRPGVDDLNLGGSHYSQVRILVDGTHYLKGMAVYSDDLPEGKDIIFNTNKPSGTPALGEKDNTVLKLKTDDPTNPFGSYIKPGGQSYYETPDGEKHLSLINKRADEGDWGEWSDHLPSQFLSKQPLPLVKKQLYLAEAEKEEEFDTIKSLTNPTVKKALLESFADDCDSAAVHLQAAALPRQKYRVILPVPELRDDEIYAPTYKTGEEVALVRYPHGGTFEIPILKVNNGKKAAKDVIGADALDAVGINKNVASRLSGADFDGDTVMVIPINGKTRIKSTPPLRSLEGFDPSMSYPYREGMKIMSKKQTQTEMGIISNLITDMTISGSFSDDEMARAVKHSMVVIDAAKHKLDYKRSEIENGIQELKNKYQGHYDEDGRYHTGASTLISRAKSKQEIPERKEGGFIGEKTKSGKDKKSYINPETGEKVYTETGRKYIDKKTGKEKIATQESTKMAETRDARMLSSGTAVEEYYADYANKMKSLANRARKEYLSTGSIKYDPKAAKEYKEEVDHLNAQLNVSLKNAPRERAAQYRTASEVKKIKALDGDLSRDDERKLSQRTLTYERARVDAKRTPIKINDKEWEAIQKGAISENKLSEILRFTDSDELKKRAMPRESKTLSKEKVNLINAMRSSGYTIEEIADRLNVSSSTVSNAIKTERS
jgi:transcriptional regulator with XRE-family HTH domain